MKDDVGIPGKGWAARKGGQIPQQPSMFLELSPPVQGAPQPPRPNLIAAVPVLTR